MPSKPSTAIQMIIFAFKKQNCYIRRCLISKKKLRMKSVCLWSPWIRCETLVVKTVFVCLFKNLETLRKTCRRAYARFISFISIPGWTFLKFKGCLQRKLKCNWRGCFQYALINDSHCWCLGHGCLETDTWVNKKPSGWSVEINWWVLLWVSRLKIFGID